MNTMEIFSVYLFDYIFDFKSDYDEAKRSFDDFMFTYNEK